MSTLSSSAGVIAAMLLIQSAAHAGPIRFVDDDALPSGDGLTWSTAYRFLQDALAEAGDPLNGVTEIRVGQGRYLPDRDEVNPLGTGDRTATFQLISGVTLLGGFAGIGAPDPDARDVNLNETILNGDLFNNDLPTTNVFHPSLTDNIFHVVTANGTNDSAVLDGFTVSGGVAGIDAFPARHGGGMLSDGGSPSLTDCTFEANLAFLKGGAIYFFNLSSAAPSLVGCTFANNTSSGGGAIYATLQVSISLTNCTFSINSAGGGEGGAINITGGALTATNCVFTGNSITVDRGGAIHATGTQVSLVDCTFTANSAPSGAGMFVGGTTSNVSLMGCTFSDNQANSGGGLFLQFDFGEATFTQCTFQANSASVDGGGIYQFKGSATLSQCVFSGNTAGNNGGAMFIDSQATVNDCTFSGNSADSEGGAAYVKDSPTFESCTFAGNTATASGGAIRLTGGHAPVFTSCSFLGNSTDLWGGAVRAELGVTPSFVNCTFSGNTAVALGGAGYFNGASPTFTNCTMVGNSTPGQAGGVYATQGSVTTLSNCIAWDNSDLTGQGESAQVTSTADATLFVNYSCIEGLTGALGGTGNIGSNPLLVDPQGPDNIPGTDDDNLRLQSGSPSIDAADNTAVPVNVTTDLDGNPRFADDPDTPDTGNPDGVNPIVDMGAYEFQPPCPWDCQSVSDGNVNVPDLLALLATWGTPGACDFDGDANTAVPDLLKLLANWGPCP